MLPMLTKHWQFRVNLDPGRSGSRAGDCARLFLLMKETLTSVSSSPWQVTASSNGRTFGQGDLVREPRDVVAGEIGSPQTWVLMKNPGLAGTYCFSFARGFTPDLITVSWSPSDKFLGGTTDVPPDAEDQVFLAVAQQWGGLMHRDGMPLRMHVMVAEDGSTRVVVTSMNRVVNALFFDRPADAVDGWASPTVNLASEDASYDMLFDFAPAVAWGPMGKMNLKLTSEGMVDNADDVQFGEVVGFDTTMPDGGHYQLVPVGLYHSEVVGQRGHHGHLSDAWWTSAALSTGTTFPEDGTKQFAVFGNIVLPWNGQKVELG